jgi:hypothetical protein
VGQDGILRGGWQPPLSLDSAKLNGKSRSLRRRTLPQSCGRGPELATYPAASSCSSLSRRNASKYCSTAQRISLLRLVLISAATRSVSLTSGAGNLTTTFREAAVAARLLAVLIFYSPPSNRLPARPIRPGRCARTMRRACDPDRSSVLNSVSPEESAQNHGSRSRLLADVRGVIHFSASRTPAGPVSEWATTRPGPGKMPLPQVRRFPSTWHRRAQLPDAASLATNRCLLVG